MDNRFEQLRYTNRFALNAELSMSQLAKQLEISTATVSKLEHDENYDARISIIKKYKERFPEVTYDYLLGATYTKQKQYNPIEENMPFGNEFYQHLEQLFVNSKKERNHAGDLEEYLTYDNLGYFLEAFTDNPNKLLKVLNTIMLSLLDIYKCNLEQTNESSSNHKNDYYISGAKTNIASQFLEYTMSEVYPRLQKLFDKIIQEDALALEEAMQSSFKDIEPF